MSWPQKKKKISREKRAELLKMANFNLFQIPSWAVRLDLLTDSGTSGMSEHQKRAMAEGNNGDESYAGASGGKKLIETIKFFFKVDDVFLVNQGRAGENIFCEALLPQKEMIILGNEPFDTTRANIEHQGGIIRAATMGPEKDPLFGGNVDLERMKQNFERAKSSRKYVAFTLITATCNSLGQTPVSIANIRQAADFARERGMPIFLDIARYAGNAFFIQEREEEFYNYPLVRVVEEMIKPVDGVLCSAKKDALGNIGGFIAFKRGDLSERISPLITALATKNIGRPDSYGGMPGYALGPLWQGIYESFDEFYVKDRIEQVRQVGRNLEKIGIPIFSVGDSAIFIDAGEFLPHIPWNEFPGHALALALYLISGVRSVEVGSLMMGQDPETGADRKAQKECLRLSIPRRLYSKKELTLVAKSFEIMKTIKDQVKGVKILKNKGIRHFDGEFAWEIPKIL